MAQDPSWFAVTRAIRLVGNSGVDLFFVLSGYLIYGSLITRPQPFFAFMSRRIVRIYPAFCVVFAAYLYLSFIYPSESRIPKESYEAWMYLLQNFALLPGIFPFIPMITVTWSLSYEMFFYLVAPVTILLLSIRNRSRMWRILFFIGMVAAIALYCAVFAGPISLIMFITGVLLHEVQQNDKIAAPPEGFALLALAGGLLINAVPLSGAGAGSVKMVILATCFFIACYSCLRGQSALLLWAFSWTPLRWLGNMSYSYYLVHGLALKAQFALLARVLPQVAQDTIFVAVMLPVMFAVTLIPATALFILVERPFSLKVSPRIVAV